MIPKIINYCWFGNNPLPKSAQKCISSWKHFFPDYEIKEWNESNYDVKKIPYIEQAYEAKKYAFVSDYARYDILYHNGGMYFDTDVEIIKPFDDILENGSFMGSEISGSKDISCMVNPGLGLGLEAGDSICFEILEFYKTLSFIKSDGELNTETVVKYTTDILSKHGLGDGKEPQKVGNITVYPKDYFNPLNGYTGKLYKTQNTHSIHWYTASWQSKKGRILNKITRPVRRVFGEDFFIKLKNRRG